MTATTVHVPTRVRTALIAMLALVACLTLDAAPASAAVPHGPLSSPAWAITVTSQPTNLIAGGTAEYYIFVMNAGGSATTEDPVVTDELPADVTATSAEIKSVAKVEGNPCAIAGQKVTCTEETRVEPGQHMQVKIEVEVSAAASGVLVDEASAFTSFAGTDDVRGVAKTESTVGASESLFQFLPGLAGFDSTATEANGLAATQAGSHPYAVTISAGFPSATVGPTLSTHHRLRDLSLKLPAGLIVNPGATPIRCTETELEEDISFEGCPPASQVGVVNVSAIVQGVTTGPTALYNMVPPHGKAAEFGFDAANVGVYVHIMGGLETGKGYALSATSNDIPAKLTIAGFRATLWGNPSDPSHDWQRGECAEHISIVSYGCPRSVPAESTPFLTMPASCSGSQITSASADSWEEPGNFVDASAPLSDLEGNPIALSGCPNLGFKPSFEITPTVTRADSPTGLSVHLHIPQNEEQEGLATANLKDATVTLPAGMTVNPSSANGMVGCSEEQIELKGPEPAQCPDASKIGSVVLETPLFPGKKFPGYVYIATPNANPFGSLLAIYIGIYEPETSIVVKLAGHVEANPVTGQLTATFDENPQLPFEDLTLNFFGGSRAALATPASCGAYRSTDALTSWATPTGVEPAIEPFEIASSASGGNCAAAPGFAPSLVAGTSSNQAGAYSPFVMTLTRKDGEQRLGAVSIKMPPGLVGMISHVTPCPEAEADAGACPAASQIGHVSVEAGVGGQPETLPEAGRPEDPVYLTQSYRGAPFGVAIVVHAEAGPFNLGTVIVRGTVNVDPHTAQVSIATDASGPYAMPTMLQGIPVDLQAVNIEVNKPQFMLNPTSCEPMSLTGSIGSAEGGSAAVSSRFQATGCQSLAFKPGFGAATQAKHTRTNGDVLKVHITSAAGEANIAKVHVDLPKELPARLATLKLACEEAQFDKNPASCPTDSYVGTATASTPVLNHPLTGPAIFVSHQGVKFPKLALVLQGEGIMVILEGETFINGKTGITSSTFSAVPDVPIRSFELNLPTGPHSALAGEGNLCANPQQMPTQITGQNGTVVERTTNVMVQGCPSKLKVSGKQISGRKGRISVYVPAAGKVTASGSGLTSATKTIGQRGTLTFTLEQSKKGSLTTNVHLVFKPAKGRTQGIRQKLSFKK